MLRLTTYYNVYSMYCIIAAYSMFSKFYVSFRKVPQRFVMNVPNLLCSMYVQNLLFYRSSDSSSSFENDQIWPNTIVIFPTNSVNRSKPKTSHTKLGPKFTRKAVLVKNRNRQQITLSIIVNFYLVELLDVEAELLTPRFDQIVDEWKQNKVNVFIITDM